MKPYAAAVGAAIVTIRTDKAIKQAALAAAVGVSQSQWSRIEKGRCVMTVQQLKVAADFLGVTPEFCLELAK